MEDIKYLVYGSKFLGYVLLVIFGLSAVISLIFNNPIGTIAFSLVSVLIFAGIAKLNELKDLPFIENSHVIVAIIFAVLFIGMIILTSR